MKFSLSIFDYTFTNYQEAENEKSKSLIALFGSLALGTADTPRCEQIEQGIKYFKGLREHQQQIKQASEELERTNKSRRKG